MPFAWFVALRYLRDAKGQTALILAAVSVGVGVVVFLSALIDGLQISLIDRTLGSQAHVTLRVPREAPRALALDTEEIAIARIVLPAPQRLRSIDRWPSVLAEVEGIAGVTAVSPMVAGAGVATRSEARESIVVQGVDPERFLAIIDIRPKMVAGRFDVAGDGVALGSKLALDLDAGIGDRIHVATTEGREDVVTVTGIFTLGNDAVDRTWIVASLRHAQALFALPGGATTLDVKVQDVFAAERVAEALRDRTGLEADSWMTLNAQLLAGLAAQNGSKTLIQILVVIAVTLGIASVLAVSVVQKSREIGILRAVGTRSGRVLAVFLVQGAVLGLVGSFLGSALGALLAKVFQGVAQRPDGTPSFPVLLDFALFASATVLATVVGVVAATIPAWRAARIDPALAIRNG